MKHFVWIIIFLALTTAVINPNQAGFKAIGQQEGLGQENIPLNNNSIVMQTFSPDRNMEINNISFFVGTYAMINRGTVTLDLFEISHNNDELMEGRKLTSAVNRAESLADNGRLGFWFPAVHIEKGKNYLAKVSIKLEDGMGLAFWKSGKNNYPSGQAYMNSLNDNNLQASDLTFIVYEKITIATLLGGIAGGALISPYIILFCLFITTILGALIVSNYPKDISGKRRAARKRPEKRLSDETALK